MRTTFSAKTHFTRRPARTGGIAALICCALLLAGSGKSAAQTNQWAPQEDWVDITSKVAWARAKEAASAVGLAQSEYYPMLAVKASGNWANLPVPLPLSPNQAGYLSVEAQEAHAVAELEWVLLDFGIRAATVRAARERLLAANLGFNARHQEIVFKVQTSFYCGPFRRRPKG